MHFPARRSRHASVPEEDRRFGRIIAADHVVLRENERGRDGEGYIVVIIDRDTNWIGAYPVPEKSAEESVNALLHFVGSGVERPKLYSDNSPELLMAART